MVPSPVQMIESGVPDSNWDAHVVSLEGHFLQMRPWLQVQEALGNPVVYARGDGWSWGASVLQGKGVRLLYAPYGPAVASPGDIGPACDALIAAGRSQHLDLVRAEPDTTAQFNDARARSFDGGQPQHTLLIDLRKDIDSIRGEMTSGRRRSINTAEKKGISIRRSRDPRDAEIFIEMIRKTAGRNQFHPHPAGYYRTVCEILFPQSAGSLYVASVNGADAAAVLSFESPTTAYYAYAAADASLSRDVIAAAPLAWQIILDAKNEGRHTFDFWGVLPDDSVNHPWTGFSKFKKTFGGTLHSRPGTFDFPINRLKYGLYRFARALRNRPLLI